MTKLLNFIAISCLLFTDLGWALDIGSVAPNVSGVNHLNKTIHFKDNYNDGYLLVFFYPRANTPGCTAQNKSLRDGFKTLYAKGVKVVGISTDSVEKQKDFHDSLNLPFDLISDQKEEIAKAFGVPVRFGFSGRQAFLIHKSKVIWLDKDAATSEQANDVLLAIESWEKNNLKK
ncbi:MAG: hypothetical protein RJB66_708 [Pseudomonadota bacterium]|jgi:peroxiredoxin Q/BCP